MNSPTICRVLARTIVRTLSPMLICRDMRSTVVSHDSVVSCPHHVVCTRAGAPLTRQRGPAGDTITPSLVTLLLGRHHPVQPFTGSRTQETPRDTRRHQGIPADTRGYQETSGDTRGLQGTLQGIPGDSRVTAITCCQEHKETQTGWPGLSAVFYHSITLSDGSPEKLRKCSSIGTFMDTNGGKFKC